MCNAGHILYQCLGREVATVHVNASALRRRRSLPKCESVRPRCTRSRCLGQVWAASINWNLRLRYVDGECCGMIPSSQSPVVVLSTPNARIKTDCEIFQIGALVAHCILFWGGDVARAYKSATSGRYDDRHHEYMTKHYKETPWWWYVTLLVLSFVLGLVVVIKEDITLPAWAYIVALLLGMVIAPFVSASRRRTPRPGSLSNAPCVEHDTIFTVWQWHSHEQPFQDARGAVGPGQTSR